MHHPGFKFALSMLVMGVLGGVTAQAQTEIRLDVTSKGKVFEGLGAVSAGASSRLLMDYPEPQRSQILDYLFKPNYGASLQHLKVEIGSDVNSTDGAEPSHMRSSGDESGERGYEWWLMEEARKRNPEIVLDSLAWGAPGWVGPGKFFSKDMAEYVARFLEIAQRKGLSIQYTGAWNERKPDYAWVKLLRSTLDAHGLNTKIVCCDMTPYEDMYSVLKRVESDPELDKAVDVIGVHYPAEFPGIAPATVRESERRFWSSEDQPNGGGGPFVSRAWKNGGRVLARRYNENYIKARFTKTEIWSPVTSYYDSLAAPHSGLMYANTPWSGYYEVQSTIWVTAHTTQFAKPGWVYMDGASGYLPNGGGTYVALHAPVTLGRDAAWSVVLETTSAAREQRITLHVGNGLRRGKAYIWQTNGTKSFERVATVPIRGGTIAYEFEPDSIYTVTTTTGQARGSGRPLPAAPFPMPYADNFDGVPMGRTAKYLSDQDGAFEAVRCEGRAGMCLEQQITQKPIPWSASPAPFTIAGDMQWADYAVAADVLIPKEGSANVQGRIDTADVFKDSSSAYPSGYVFSLAADGEWMLLSTRFKHAPAVLAHGNIRVASGWHRLSLGFHGTTITGAVDGEKVCTMQDTTHTAGMMGLGSNWTKVQFDNLSITR